MTFRLPRGLRAALFGSSIAVTFALSVTPSLPAAAPSVNDKLGHVAAYAVNGALAALAFPSPAGLTRALVGLLAMGTGVELLQVALPHREGSWGDAGANALGLGVGGVLPLLRRRSTRA